tara:strand:+ start:243 stop:431 length:189 start_codon:yes stop_codon:yes gene_type:complete
MNVKLTKKEVQCLRRSLNVFVESLWQGAKVSSSTLRHYLDGEDKFHYETVIELQKKLRGESK